MPVKILLDTNFLLIPGQFKVDIFSEIHRICDFSYEIVVLDRTIDELESIAAQQRGKDKMAAKLALQLIKVKKPVILASKTATFKNVDKTILELAAKERLMVATQDRLLKSELKKLGIGLIELRQEKYLRFE